MGLEDSPQRLTPPIVPLAAPNQPQDFTIAPRAVDQMQTAFQRGLLNKTDFDSFYDKITGTTALRKKTEKAGLKNALAEQEQLGPLEIKAKQQALQGGIDLQPKAQQVAGGALDQQLFQQQTQNQLNETQAASMVEKTHQDLDNIRTHGNQDTIKRVMGEYGLTLPMRPDGSDVDWNKAQSQADAVGASKLYFAQLEAAKRGITLKEGKSPDPNNPGATISRLFPVNAAGQPYDPMKQAFVSWDDLKAGSSTMPSPSAGFGIHPKPTTAPAAPATGQAPGQAPAPTGQAPAPQVGSVDDQGTVTGYEPPAVPTEMQLRDEVAKDPAYGQWRKSLGAFEKLNATWADVQKKMATDPKGNFKADDIELASNFIKLYDPEAVIREFKWDKLEHARDWADTIKNAQSLLAGKATLTPQQRQNLVNVAQNTFHAQEKAITAHVQQFSDLEKKYNYNNVLGPDARALLNPAATPTAAAGESSRPYAGKTWTIGQQYRLPSGVRTVTGFDASGKPLFN